MTGDVDVAMHSSALRGKYIALGITGGIAATEAVRLCRELRRHGAQITVMMTTAACKVITPLAVGWASQGPVITEWKSDMSQLEQYDAILVAPASRNFISRYVHGMMDHPLLMACSAARTRNTPIMFVPSMHNDLYDDPVTTDLLSKLEFPAEAITGPFEEGRYKQPNPVKIVADLCHIVNRDDNSRHFAVTLGANRAPIDAVRAIQNASSGRTGWAICEHLHRHGHFVTAIAGKTSADPSFDLPAVVRAGSPDEMLQACLKLAGRDEAPLHGGPPDGWVHAAAVLDYIPNEIEGKKASGDTEWELVLKPGPKHIQELSEMTKNTIRIGFKLETNVAIETLHERSLKQIETYGVDATIANLMEEMNDEQNPRAYIVTIDGITPLENMNSVCESILSVLTR